jgi:RHS repeat-associated protein
VASYSESAEYGAPRTPATAYDSYGWLGGKQRSSNTLGGLTLMGVRLYNSAVGRFLSLDPVAGGNPNAFVYPVDPIDSADLDGRHGDPSYLCFGHPGRGSYPHGPFWRSRKCRDWAGQKNATFWGGIGGHVRYETGWKTALDTVCLGGSSWGLVGRWVSRLPRAWWPVAYGCYAWFGYKFYRAHVR